ncbi:hypothetical protein BD779DRAFT_675124 [Infundibulicybe gibba]|nr:hypothetical protein BD779DRAFT_675124 [Infundibulicybe gibba]
MNKMPGTYELTPKGSQATLQLSPSHPSIEPVVFHGFTDFEVDLSWPTEPSPSPSTSELPPSTPSPRPSVSISSQASISMTLGRKPTLPRLAPIAAASILRGSWPLAKYAGRGTPIDRHRTVEWGGLAGEGVGEDGVLFPTTRSPSMDSAVRASSRSVSPDWNDVSPASQKRRSNSRLREASSKKTLVIDKTIPEAIQINIDGIGAEDPGEWGSFVQTVLSTSQSASTSQHPSDTELGHDTALGAGHEPSALDATRAPLERTEEFKFSRSTEHAAPPAEVSMSPEEIRNLDTGLDIDLNLDAPLDLGLSVNGHTDWPRPDPFAATAAESGRDSPSVYSQSDPPTPAHRLRPPCMPPSTGPPQVPRQAPRPSPTISRRAQSTGCDICSSACVWCKKYWARPIEIASSLV